MQRPKWVSEFDWKMLTKAYPEIEAAPEVGDCEIRREARAQRAAKRFPAEIQFLHGGVRLLWTTGGPGRGNDWELFLDACQLRALLERVERAQQDDVRRREWRAAALDDLLYREMCSAPVGPNEYARLRDRVDELDKKLYAQALRAAGQPVAGTRSPLAKRMKLRARKKPVARRRRR